MRDVADNQESESVIVLNDSEKFPEMCRERPGGSGH